MLGDGTADNKLSPVQIGLDKNWSQVSCGRLFNLAIDKNGTLWAWGNNIYGQLGIGKTKSKYSPVQIGLDTDWKQVYCGDDFSIAIKSDGTIWSWGDNTRGQLGDGTTTQRNFPIQIGNVDAFSKVSCGAEHIFALNISSVTSVPEIETTITSNIYFNINPNPANDLIYLEYLKNENTLAEINIYSLEGKLLDKIQKLSGNSTKYNLNKFVPGDYMIVLNVGKENVIRKLVIIR
jgi:hypothetical protein